MSYERKDVSGLARELGVSAALIYRWREEYSQYGKGSFPGNGITKMTPEAKELSDMKKRWASFPRAIVDLWIYQEVL